MGSKFGVTKVAAIRIGISVDRYQKMLSDGFKHCTKCKIWQPKELFNKDNHRGDGLASICRHCNSKKKEKVGGPESARQETLAVEAIRKAIRNGRMRAAKELPCFYCGNNASHYHHYLGYEEKHRLDVRAACRSCHRKLHYFVHG